MKPQISEPSWTLTLCMIFVLMLILMTLYESAKQIAYPSLSLWESHIITILFTSFLAVLLLAHPLRTAFVERKSAAEAVRQLQESEEDLRRSRAEYRSFVESLEDSLYTVDPELRYLLVNTRHLARRGLAPGACIGRSYGDFHTSRETEVFAAYSRQVMATGGIVQDEYEKGGRYFLRRFSPVFDPGRVSVVAVTVLSSDITERILMERRFAETTKKLSLMHEITSHDIFNQLLILSSCLSLAGKQTGDPVLKNYLGRCTLATDTIYAHVRFSSEYRKIGVASPAWQVPGQVIRTAAGNPKTLDPDIDPSLGDYEIYADPLLEKVFYNLMENARKYAGPGARIRFTCTDVRGTLIIACNDNGPGIADGEKEKIFFRGYGKNTGLGLFLIREILAITGIGIRETGDPGNGARFEILVPSALYRARSDACTTNGCNSSGS